MNKKKLHISFILILALHTCLNALTVTENRTPEHIAYNIKAERIPLSPDSIKVTWQMDRSYPGDFVVGRSETPLNTIEDILKSKLVGIFNPALEGILIDKNLEQDKKYYYIVVAKEKLLKREISILRDVNVTTSPVLIHSEPSMIKSLRADTRDQGVRLRWDTGKADGLIFNLYRSPSIINTRQELTAASKLVSTMDNSFTDITVPEFGTYYYAVTVTDKNNIEYFNPIPGENFTTEGAFLKEKAISSPLNVQAYAGKERTIIVKWLRSSSRADREVTGYEIYRSDEIINSQFSLKKSRLINIADKDTTFYTDIAPGAGQFYYAVFPRYSDGTVDINFETAASHTKAPVEINIPYSITGIKAEALNGKIILKWEFAGNQGNEIVKIIRTEKIPGPQDDPEKLVIGSANINSKSFTVNRHGNSDSHYGIFIDRNTAFSTGINITTKIPALREKEYISESSEENKSDPEKPAGSEKETGLSSELGTIIRDYFYKGRYELASKELNIFIKNTDKSSERALAKLFLGKTWIELNEFEKAILILNSRDVKENFPEESEFWSEFATVRLK